MQLPKILQSKTAGLTRLRQMNTSEAVEAVAGAGSRVAARVGAAAGRVPDLVEQGSSLLGSVIHAANETAPLVAEQISEFSDQLPLITGFASAYAGKKLYLNADKFSLREHQTEPSKCRGERGAGREGGAHVLQFAPVRPPLQGCGGGEAA